MLPIKYHSWNKIVLDLDKSGKIMDWWKQQDIETVDNFPFNKGVITCKEAIKSGDNTYDIHLAFVLKPEYIEIEEIYGNNGRAINRWELLYEGTVIDGVRNFNISYEPVYHAAKERMLDLSILFLGIVKFIVHYKENKEVFTKKMNNVIDPKKRKKKSSKNTVHIPNKIYTVNRIPIESTESIQRERHTEAWEVRGHLRQFKNGKVVWIKPYIKGDKNKIKPKEYKVTEFQIDKPSEEE